MSFASSIGSGAFVSVPSLLGSGYGSSIALAVSSFTGSALTAFTSLTGSAFGLSVAASSVYLYTFTASSGYYRP